MVACRTKHVYTGPTPKRSVSVLSVWERTRSEDSQTARFSSVAGISGVMAPVCHNSLPPKHLLLFRRALIVTCVGGKWVDSHSGFYSHQPKLALFRTMAVPSGVRGPADFWALIRLASVCASVIMGEPPELMIYDLRSMLFDSDPLSSYLCLLACPAQSGQTCTYTRLLSGAVLHESCRNSVHGQRAGIAQLLVARRIRSSSHAGCFTFRTVAQTRSFAG